MSITTAVGYLLAEANPSLDILIPIAGVFLLAAGSSALNQVQESVFDRKMKRTANRPLPSGKISISLAAVFSSLLIATGFLMLWLLGNIYAGLVGLITVVWYNVIYTYLKRKTAYAIVPGAVIGALPPLIGWLYVTENLTFEYYLVALIIFVWQIPHFWLLLLIYSEEYHAAGFPTLLKFMSANSLRMMTFVWIISLFVFCLMLIWLSSNTVFLFVSTLLFGVYLIYRSLSILRNSIENNIIKKVFITLNMFVFYLLLGYSVDKFL